MNLSSFHDEIAARSSREGKKAADFRAAAQNHANATWLFFLGAAGLWFFYAWYWALIPGLFGVFVILQSLSATAVASRLDKLESSQT